jgi:methanogenic corrinoid protein MtbC1
MDERITPADTVLESPMSRRVMIERFHEALISGDRTAARQMVDECLEADLSAEQIIENLFWPALEMIERLFRNDQLSVLSHNYATRLMRMLADQMQLRLQPGAPRDKRVMMFCGPNEPNELAGQMAADLLEAAGYEILFAGGGVANDEIIAQIGTVNPDILLLFSSAPSDLPHIRQLIDQLHDTGVCPELQIVVGGGVFNRAPGLAEEIGADLWAITPIELVKAINEKPERRAPANQRTVGRRRRSGRQAAA